MRVLTITAVLSTIGLFACSTSREAYTVKPGRSRSHIYHSEIQKSSATNAFDLIETLRPYWLEGRGPKSVLNRATSYPVVYVDDIRHGDIYSLTTIPVYNIVQIQLMNAGDATLKFGTGHPSGAILITMFY